EAVARRLTPVCNLPFTFFSCDVVEMQLLVVRHAIAEEREKWSPRDDKLRPLTDDGKKKMKEAAKGLRALVPKIDVLATSPLTRAAQTAQLLAKVYETGEPVTVEALAPGQRPPALATWLRTQAVQKAPRTSSSSRRSRVHRWLRWRTSPPPPRPRRASPTPPITTRCTIFAWRSGGCASRSGRIPACARASPKSSGAAFAGSRAR